MKKSTKSKNSLNTCDICYHPADPVYAIEKVVYHGASVYGVHAFKGDLVINFTSQSNLKVDTKDLPKLSNQLDLPFKEIMVPWPDLSVPMVKPGFWKALHDQILKKKYTSVCFQCSASHGRTGTALAAMLIANAEYSAHEAVEFVREDHCEDAVETDEQVEYLKQLDVFYNNADPESYDITPSMYSGWVFYNHDEGQEEGFRDTDDDEELKIMLG